VSDYERRVLEYEAARNEAMDKWFNARVTVERTGHTEFIWESGFRMAWEASQERIVQLREELELTNKCPWARMH
jgi:hypothetical protein